MLAAARVAADPLGDHLARHCQHRVREVALAARAPCTDITARPWSPEYRHRGRDPTPSPVAGRNSRASFRFVSWIAKMRRMTETDLLDADLSLRMLMPDVMYASSSVVIESVPAQSATVPVAELLHDSAVEQLLYSMAAEQPATSEVAAFESFEEADLPVGPLTDAQWSDLLSDLAEEQQNLG